MDRKIKQRVIAIEEHYWDRDVGANFDNAETLLPVHLRRRLEDLGAQRLKEMDDAGIDVQLLSHAGPETPRINAEVAVNPSRLANDRLRVHSRSRRSSHPAGVERRPRRLSAGQNHSRALRRRLALPALADRSRPIAPRQFCRLFPRLLL